MLESRFPVILLGLALACAAHLTQAAPPLGKSAVEAALQVSGEAEDGAANSAVLTTC